MTTHALSELMLVSQGLNYSQDPVFCCYNEICQEKGTSWGLYKYGGE